MYLGPIERRRGLFRPQRRSTSFRPCSVGYERDQMSTNLARGTKRTCQNPACELPFYDLNRTEFACPNCGSAFDMQRHAEAQALQQARGPQRRPARPFISQVVANDPLPVEATDLDAVDVEIPDDDAGTVDGDVMLETEDEADDGSAIADIPAPGDDD